MTMNLLLVCKTPTYNIRPKNPFKGSKPQTIPNITPKACLAQYITSRNSS